MLTSEIRSHIESNPNSFMPNKWDQLNSDKILKEISLDNEEALKKIKNQLTEIKISTSKNSGNPNPVKSLIAHVASSKLNDLNLNQKSILSSISDDVMPKTNKPIIADNLNKFNKNKSTKSKGKRYML